jgi:histidinol dehydrogenase
VGENLEISVSVWDELDQAARAAFVERGSERVLNSELMEQIRVLIEDVRANGDEALVRALERYDRCQIEPGRLLVSPAEFDQAKATIEQNSRLVAALRLALGNSRRFNELAIQHSRWQHEIAPGIEVGETATPIASAGLFVPCGKGSFPSVLVQIGTPAVVAGVLDVTVAVPPMPGTSAVDPAVLWVAAELGIDRVLRCNGPAGIAAMALGTETVPRARKVLGPGSPAVQAAQSLCQMYGCQTHMLLGPTEAAVVADASADPRLLAADLLNEAEHGSDSTSVLVTPSRSLVKDTLANIEDQLAALPEPRREWALCSLGRNGGVILVSDLEQAAEVVDALAPEHLQLAGSEAEGLVERIHHAGEILVGQASLFTQANYVIGVPASLPTGGFAAVTGGVTAATFQKRTSLARISPDAMRTLAPASLTLAEYEGFPAHANAVQLRLDD